MHARYKKQGFLLYTVHNYQKSTLRLWTETKGKKSTCAIQGPHSLFHLQYLLPQCFSRFNIVDDGATCYFEWLNRTPVSLTLEARYRIGVCDKTNRIYASPVAVQETNNTEFFVTSVQALPTPIPLAPIPTVLVGIIMQFQGPFHWQYP